MVKGLVVSVVAGNIMESRGSTVNKIADATKKAVEHAINVEIRSGVVDSFTNLSASGDATSHLFALTSFDTTSTLPDFLPLIGVAWPDTVKNIWKTFKANSIVGLFPALSRAWITVDNKLLLWNYGSGKDFFVYDEIPGLIVAVGNPVKPVAGVFQSSITFVFPVATPTSIYLLGLCLIGETPAKHAKIYVVDLGFSVVAPILIVKFAELQDEGRIFMAGADGFIYELKYTKENTLLFPKVRLVNHFLPFGGVPILGAVSSLVSTIKQTWGKQTPALRDFVVEARRKLLFTLDTENKLEMWKIKDDGFKFLTSVKFDREAFERRRYPEASIDVSTTLVKMFCVSSHSDNCSLIVVASNGEQYRYTCEKGIWSGTDASLALRERLPSHIPSGREVSVCLVADGISLLCHTDKNEEAASSDSVTVITFPKAILPPHHNCRDVVANFEPAVSHMVRVDAIAEVPIEGSVSPNELCSQVCCSPKQFVFLHRHGISTFIKLRPVDTLHMILSSSGSRVRESLLQRFSSLYSASDYCCMLLQIAVGCTNVSVVVDGQYIDNGIANSPICQVEKPVGKAVDALSMEQLGCQLFNMTSPEAQRLARDILRSATMPTWHEGLSYGNDDTRQIVVQVSPFALGVVAYIGRALYNVWQMPMANLQLRELAIVEVALCSLIRLLNSLKKDVWSDNLVQPSVPFHWDQCKVTLTVFPNESSVSSYDFKMLQSAFLYSSHSLCERVLQTIKFVRQALCMPLFSGGDKATFAQVVCDQSLAQRMALNMGNLMMSSQQIVGFSQQEHIEAMTQLQMECPYFFGSIDFQEYTAKAELEQLLSARSEGLHTFSESKMIDWESSAAQKAASLWSSGALQSICQQLKALEKEDVIVRLFLHAARQLDPNNSTFDIYLLERSGAKGQGDAVNSTLDAIYQQKIKVLTAITKTLEETWETRRNVVDELIGGPLSLGSIWQIEPADEFAHCFLFDWMCVPRDDATITSMLKEALITARSPFIESYLQRNGLTLGELYAHYLRRIKKNYKKAIEICAAMAQAPLTHIMREERILYRLRCWSEAKECAYECDSEQLALLEQNMKLAEAQLNLSKVICEFINSGLPQLDRQVSIDGQGVLTERQVASEQLELVDNCALSTSQLLEIAGMFCAFGGAEIQLDVLSATNVKNPALYAVCLERAFNRRNASVEEIARRVIGKCGHIVAFPLSHVTKILEAHAFLQSPCGSTFTVDVLSESGIACGIIFSTLTAILEKKDTVGVPCESFDKSGVTDAFLVHSLAVALYRVVFSPQIGSAQSHVLSGALNTVREGINRAAHFSDDEYTCMALNAAESILEQCHLAASRLTSRFVF